MTDASGEATPDASSSEIPDTIEFHYIKSNCHRVIHVDGGTGSLAPIGEHIVLSLFNERMPIPQTTIHDVKAGGMLGDERKDERHGKEGVVREVEVTLQLNLDAADRIANWLRGRIDEARRLRQKEDKG